MFKPGDRVRKCFSEEGDMHSIGKQGTVVSVLGPVDPVTINGRLIHGGYFVRWDDFRIPVFVVGFKVEKVEENS